MDWQTSLTAMRNYFKSGETKTEIFRREQLMKLRSVIMQYEDDIYQALYQDLKKSKEECWVTENGILLSEINHALKNLNGWMKPRKVKTNLLNFPSKSYILSEPLGVVLIISPWNYPLQLLLKPMVGAIAAGNCVVLKASEFALATGSLMKKMIEENFDPNYIRFVEGEGSAVVPDMINAFDFDHVLFTGSTTIGRAVYQLAASRLIPVTLELGGKSPCVIESDADLKVAARRIVVTKFSNCGQMCIAPDYLLVHHSVKDKMIQELKQTLHRFFGENAGAAEHYGKIINEKQFDRIIGYLQDGRLIYGGKHNRENLYIEPSLLDDVQPGSKIMCEEIFGPILPILSYENRQDALDVIEKNKNPLAFYVFTSSSEKEKQWLNAVAFGGGCVNNASWHLTNHHLPFGGRGFSGIGQYQGQYSFETFSHKKSILKTPTWFDPAIKYPPFKGKLNLFKRFIGS
jgi:aldehyde dehydrogenase (NAD+)